MLGLIFRIIASGLAIVIAAFLSPMRVSSFGTAIIVAIVIGLIDWALASFTPIKQSRFGRGILGFVVSVVILYVTGMLIDGFTTGIFGAIIGGIVLAILDLFMPVGGEIFNKK